MSLPNLNRLDAGMASTTRSNILGAALAIVASVGLFWLVIYEFKYVNYLRSVDGSLGVVTGHPVWKTFQDRVLAPYIVKALSFGSLEHYVVAHIFFQLVTVAIAAFLCWRLGRKYGGSDLCALFALTVFVLCFVALLLPPWLYSWDFIDMIVFAVFIEFVLSGRSLLWFVGLFAVATWNRDSADFIALWLITDALVRNLYQRRQGLAQAALDWRRIVAGIVCIGIGLVIAELLRRNLLIEEMAPKLYPDNPIVAGHRYNLVLPLNIAFLEHPLRTGSPLIVIAFLTATIWLGAAFARLDPQRHLTLFLLELAMVAALFLFGRFNEPRIFLFLIPFVVISAVMVWRGKNASVFAGA